MNFAEIIQLKLIKSNFIKLPSKDHFKLIYIDKINYQEYIKDINKIISLIHIDLPNWSNSPDLSNVVKRFNANSNCLLFYYNNDCIGWNWSNNNVCFDWVNMYQKLDDSELYVGGCFVSKSVNRPADAGRYNYNMICDYLFNEKEYTTIYGYVDEWNKPAIRINLQTGVKFYSFLNKNSN